VKQQSIFFIATLALLLHPQIGQGSESRCVDTEGSLALKKDGITLLLPEHSEKPGKSITVRKISKKEFGKYCDVSQKYEGGPAIPGAIEIESKQRPETPLAISIRLPPWFLKKLGHKYRPALFQYELAVSSEDTIDYLNEVPLTFDESQNRVCARITPSPSTFIETKDQTYVLLLVVGSKP
jgi:hypothetical protein